MHVMELFKALHTFLISVWPEWFILNVFIMHIINQPLLYSYFSSYCYLRHTKDLGEIENNNGTLLQLMITVPLDDPIIYDLPIKVIKIDEFLSNYYLVI